MIIGNPGSHLKGRVFVFGISHLKSLTMTENSPQIAKISPPRPHQAFPRKRLFAQLDRLRSHPVIWVSGPPGSGKTTLVSSYLEARKLPCLWYQVDQSDSDIASFFYFLGQAGRKAAPRKKRPLPLLTREYLEAVPTFTLRFFENLYSRMKFPSMFIFDNYQEVPKGSLFHEVILHGLSHIPEGLNVILVSRKDPPPLLVRMHANEQMKVLGWDDLRLTIEESSKIVQLHAGGQSEDSILHLHNSTDGWVAGLILMLESARGKGVAPSILENLSREEMFAYFACEIFEKSDEDIKDFLLKTALLPQMTAKMAEELTGLPQAGRILSELSRTHYFTEKRFQTESMYQYHALFREFLLAQGKAVFPPEDRTNFYHQAASLLEEAGQEEAAIPLFAEIGDWDGAVRSIIKLGNQMIIQGRNKTLEEWLDRLPNAVLESHPWLLYLKGYCLYVFNPPLSRPFLEKAMEKFKIQKNADGFFAVFDLMVHSITAQFEDLSPLDKWIRVLEETIKVFPDKEKVYQAAPAMLEALQFRQPWHPKIDEWLERTRFFTEASPAINRQISALAQIVYNHIYIRDFKKALNAIELIKQKQQVTNLSPVSSLSAILTKVTYYHFAGMHEKCMQNLSEAMNISQEEGIHYFDHLFLIHGVASALNIGDSKTARILLARFGSSFSSKGSIKSFFYYGASAREALSRGDYGKASIDADQALKLIMDFGFPNQLFFCQLLKSQVAHALGKQKESLDHLSKASHLARRMKSNLFNFMVLSNKALYAFDDRKEESGLSFLGQALRIGREEGYFDPRIIQPDGLSKLCMKALEVGIEVEYVQELIRRLKVRPEKPPLHLENWPWPLKIFTLGRFAILKDGEPVQFSRKVQQRPLSVLKAIIAFGGRQVREDRIMDALWPEADGDMASQTLATNLHRLRQLLGYEEAIQRKEGRLTLDDRLCWVDVRAFEALQGQAETWLKNREPGRAFPIIEKALDIYLGPFLVEEINQPWTVSLGEQLRNKFLRYVEKLGRYYQETNQWDKALDFYLKGLEIDDLAEEFYSGLMICYHRLGRKIDARAVYRRYQKTISLLSGLTPSAKIETLNKFLHAE
jgi:LuxR family transcriptional regulator, maltose regulon positive regulatory protein